MIDGSKPPKRKGTSRSATLPSGLTEKQEAFCQAVYDGHSFSDAYRASYDCSNSKPASVNRQAHEMILNLKVTSRIRDLQRGREEQQRMQALSRSEKVLKKLEQLGFDDSVGDSAQLKALELLGKSKPRSTGCSDKFDCTFTEIGRHPYTRNLEGTRARPTRPPRTPAPPCERTPTHARIHDVQHKRYKSPRNPTPL